MIYFLYLENFVMFLKWLVLKLLLWLCIIKLFFMGEYWIWILLLCMMFKCVVIERFNSVLDLFDFDNILCLLLFDLVI